MGRGCLMPMMRIFEVNIGTIAACVPILETLYGGRHMHARISGRDPHEMLRAESQPFFLFASQIGTSARFWLRRPSPVYIPNLSKSWGNFLRR